MPRTRPWRVATIALSLTLAGLSLSACREDGQNRPLGYDKGNYGGKPDTVLSEKQREDLRQRGSHQNF